MIIQYCLKKIFVDVYLCFCELLQCESNDDISKEHQCAVADIVQALESLPVFSLVKEVMSETCNAVKSAASSALHTNGWPSCGTTRTHYLTMLLLFWPYPEVSNSRGTRLQTLVDWQLDNCGTGGRQLLQNEVRQLRHQFQSVLGYVRRCNCHCSKGTA